MVSENPRGKGKAGRDSRKLQDCKRGAARDREAVSFERMGKENEQAQTVELCVEKGKEQAGIAKV